MAKPISEWTTEDLQALLGSEETSNLEFKDGRSLAREPGKKADIAKDVSAMANAAGGLIVYGIHERDSVADSIAGCPAEHGKAEWFEQVINNNIEPKVQGVTIKRIDLPEDKLALVVDVPKATTFAPHQNKTDGRYYRRYNTTSQVMLDHEVRDLMNRSTAPELYTRSTVAMTETGYFVLRVFLGNRSREPSLYTSVEIILGDEMKAPRPSEWTIEPVAIGYGGRAGSLFRRALLVPNHMPIIKEREELIFETPVQLHLSHEHHFSCIVSAPGFRMSETFDILRPGMRSAQIVPAKTSN